MRKQSRDRVTGPSRFRGVLTAGLAAGLAIGLPLLAAGQAAAASPQISFVGGAGLLSCDSRPSASRITVPAESTVRFLNRLGDSAILRIDGTNRTRVGNNQTAEVLFHRGTVRVQMVPDCGLSLSSDFDAVSVSVTPSSSQPAPAPAPTTGGPGGGARPSASPSASASASASPSALASGTVSPSDTPLPTVDGGLISEDAGAVVEDTEPGDGLAAEPLDPVAAEQGPNGLLAIMAVVCLLGVSAGAIRAIVAQRANRARVA